MLKLFKADSENIVVTTILLFTTLSFLLLAWPVGFLQRPLSSCFRPLVNGEHIEALSL